MKYSEHMPQVEGVEISASCCFDELVVVRSQIYRDRNDLLQRQALDSFGPVRSEIANNFREQFGQMILSACVANKGVVSSVPVAEQRHRICRVTSDRGSQADPLYSLDLSGFEVKELLVVG